VKFGIIMDVEAGPAANLEWLVNEQGIAPDVPVIDKSQRDDGTFSREDFSYDEVRDVYTCPAGKTLTTTGHVSTDHARRYLASVPECRSCPHKPKCFPNTPARRIVRDVNEAARDVARAFAKTEAFARSRRDRKKVEMLFAHLKRILRLGRLNTSARL
jgi:Transposase DDE domain